jgi:sugar lactone lactonase YvrE
MNRGAQAQQDDASPAVKPGTITTVVGGGPNEIPALNANLNLPWELAVDKQGNYYVATGGGSTRVFKISPAGVITVVAGNGLFGYSGDGGPAVEAMLANPHGVAVDDSVPANVYIDDWANCLIRKVDGATGVITTIAGIVTKPFKPTCKSSGDGGAAKDAAIDIGWTVAVDPRNHDVYFTEDGVWEGSDGSDGRVRRIAGGEPTGTITTVAGTNNQCGGNAPNGTLATDANLCHPQSVALDTSATPANIFVDNWGDGTIREVVGSTKKMYTIAGGFGDPWQMAIQVSGKTTTITLPDFGNSDVVQFPITYSGGAPVTGKGAVIAGSGIRGTGLAIDAERNIIIGDQASNHILEIVKKTGKIISIEGWATNAYSDPAGIKDAPGTGITLNLPTGAYIEPKSGNLLVAADQTEAVYLLDTANGEVSDFAGDGFEGFAGDGLAADNAKVEVNNPDGTVEDSKGDIFIAEANNHDVREVIAATGEITTVVGGSEGHLNGPGYSGNGGKATEARIDNPHFLAMDADENLYISEYLNCVIRKVDAKTQIISTYAGTGQCGYNGSNRPATMAELDAPQGITFDGQGNLYIAEGDDVIRKVNPATGLISIVAGGVGGGYNGDGPALTRALNSPQGVFADKNGNLFFADDNNNILRWVDPGGQMVTFAGSPPGSKGGSYGFGGDGGPATSALLAYPRGITRDSQGNFYFTDRNNDRVRKVTVFAGYGRSTGLITFSAQQTSTTSAAQTVTLSAIGPVTSISVTAGFKAISHCSGLKLAFGETCQIEVTFAPGTNGTIKGALTIDSDAYLAGQANFVDLTGTGILPPAATPILTPGTGSYPGAQTVTITDTTPGAEIHYTVNGRTPSSSSAKYTKPIAVSASGTIEAVASATYTLATDTPEFAPAGGTYKSARTVRITDKTPKAAIFFTTDGSVPTTSSTKYTKAISVTATETINAIAIAAGSTQSAVATATYTIN